MNWLTSPRAGLPVNARVTAVPVNAGSARAALCTGCAPLSGQRRKAVPHWTATAPAASASWTPRWLMIPPAATSGSRVAAATAPSNRCSGTAGGAAAAENVPRCAPASGPCTHSPSAPRPAAITASSGAVTVAHTWLPAARSAPMTAASGQPKVKLTTAGGWASRTASFASHPSSSQSGAPGRAPSAAASGSSSAR
jgi:hypothetical protein